MFAGTPNLFNMKSQKKSDLNPAKFYMQREYKAGSVPMSVL